MSGFLNGPRLYFTTQSDGILILISGYCKFHVSLYAYNGLRARIVVGFRLSRKHVGVSGGVETLVGPVGTTGFSPGSSSLDSTNPAGANNSFAGAGSITTCLYCNAYDRISLRTIRVGTHDYGTHADTQTVAPAGLSQFGAEFLSA